MKGERRVWITIMTATWLLASSVMDIRKRSVPVWMLLPGGIMAIIVSVYQQSPLFDILGGMLPGIVLLVTALVTKKAGYGDGMVLLFLGILSGRGSLLVFAAGLLLIAFFSLVLLALHKVGRNTRIPSLPFLTAAWLLWCSEQL